MVVGVCLFHGSLFGKVEVNFRCWQYAGLVKDLGGYEEFFLFEVDVALCMYGPEFKRGS
jgi:hypothetical protein